MGSSPITPTILFDWKFDMRPEKARRVIQKAIDHYIKTNDPSLLYKNCRAVQRLLKRSERIETELSKKFNFLYEPAPSGYESYGYQDQESIHLNMIYISDRWACAWRIRWLLDGIEDKMF